jgi:glycosyltransferase involved in cell wall biosynthesis
MAASQKKKVSQQLEHDFPFVSVLTPTYNRRRFIPSLIECYKAQEYPKDRMEWIILDDGTDCVRDIFEEASKTIPNLRFNCSIKNNHHSISELSFLGYNWSIKLDFYQVVEK